ncbi:hypothetical protein LEP1GSC083_5162 [Leptospira interrogans serovar Pyrogenes str. L0374]|uniref:Uncharacterized protein n=1 Tax=Leptospira interrogans serovar Pyrogenes str. L0374 TaxID=1049928 RepID=M6K2Y8_LEPIR|nr:hypothetical protein LEP1GSC083_5162 [Leptospira interrogans serovar Pyrogenes str. L0374]EMN61397.1 hypothetical protein LEP1GSC092_2445 [Leptospira interrogans serovar Pyrogenes str. R168]
MEFFNNSNKLKSGKDFIFKQTLNLLIRTKRWAWHAGFA